MSSNINLEIMKSGANLEEEKYFERDRFIQEDILAKFEKIENIDKIMYLDILFDDKLEIHVNDKEEITRDFIKEILSKLPIFDNYVQDFCERNYKRRSFDVKNYMVALSWISIEQNKVIMRYWGEYVNIELEAIFIKNKLEWENKEIYFC